MQGMRLNSRLRSFIIDFQDTRGQRKLLTVSNCVQMVPTTAYVTGLQREKRSAAFVSPANSIVSYPIYLIQEISGDGENWKRQRKDYFSLC